MHSEEYYRELMNAEIDGAITEEEAGMLAERLEADPRARAYYEELRRTVRLLDGARDAPPPPALRERILGAVRLAGPDGARRPAAARGGSSLRSRYIPVFASGLAAGLLLYAAVAERSEGPVPAPGAGGTIGLPPGAPETVRGQTTEFEGAGVTGSVAASVDSAGMSIVLRLRAQTEAAALFEYGAGLAFESMRSPEGAPFQMEVDAGSLLIVHRGTGEYLLRLRITDPAPGPVDLKIVAGGETVARIVLQTP